MVLSVESAETIHVRGEGSYISSVEAYLHIARKIVFLCWTKWSLGEGGSKQGEYIFQPYASYQGQRGSISLTSIQDVLICGIRKQISECSTPLHRLHSSSSCVAQDAFWKWVAADKHQYAPSEPTVNVFLD